MLTLLLILLPIVAGVITLLVGANLAKQVALVGALAELGLALFVWSQFDPSAGVQFGFKYNWLASAGISFAAGLDGISLVLVLLTAFLTPLIVLSTFEHTYKNSAAFYSLILFMSAALDRRFYSNGCFLILSFLRSSTYSGLFPGSGLGWRKSFESNFQVLHLYHVR